MSSAADDTLARLRDIQYPAAPEDVSTGLIFMNLCLILLVAAGLYRRWHRHRQQWRYEALGVINRARSLPPEEARLILARMLRQIMLLRGQRTVTDPEIWLQTLDAEFKTSWFTRSAGRQFGEAVYRPCTLHTDDLQPICRKMAELIRSLPAVKAADATRQGR